MFLPRKILEQLQRQTDVLSAGINKVSVIAKKVSEVSCDKEEAQIRTDHH